MLQTDRVRPNEYVFNSLIGVLGHVGYTKKAFQVFNQVYGINDMFNSLRINVGSC